MAAGYKTRLEDMPGIAALCEIRTVSELADIYGVSRGGMYRRLYSLGLKAKGSIPEAKPKPPKPEQVQTKRPVPGQWNFRQWNRMGQAPEYKPQSIADRAADFLRKFGPVYHVDERGRPTATGEFFCRGRVMMAEAELVAFAERKGFTA